MYFCPPVDVLFDLTVQLTSADFTLLTHFELRRLVFGICVLLHQHHMQDAERVLDPEDGPVAPGCGENHQPAEPSLGRDESGSVAVPLHLDPRVGIGSRGEGRLAPGLDQLRGAVLLHDFALSAGRMIILAPVRFSGSISLLHLGIRSRLLRPAHSAGRLIV